jgi:hypothetical protein
MGCPRSDGSCAPSAQPLQCGIVIACFTCAAEKTPAVLDIGEYAKKKLKNLRKGRGALMIKVQPVFCRGASEQR